MLDVEGQQNFFRQLHELWIQPELEKRFGATGIPENFKVREALIRLPSGIPAIVDFNEEIEWTLQFKVAADVSIETDQRVHLHEVEKVERAMPPVVDGQRVAFIYLFWSGHSYQVIFDFSPNNPDFSADLDDFQLGISIADHIYAKMRELSVQLSKNSANQLQEIGLWIATSLIPYPLSKIIERISVGELDEARQVLVSHCNAEFIATSLVETWQPIKTFKERQQLFDDALFLHRDQRYHGSINTLIGQIEGVIVDWLHEVIPASDVKWRTKSRIDQFHAALQAIPEFEYAYRTALDSTIEFLQEGEPAGKPFQKFTNWLDNIDPNFPARHALSHGKYVKEIYTEENSIKLFLLLDTICQFMIFYEVRVLGRNLGQNPEGDAA